MKKEDKTNVCRILDAAGVKYTMFEIETDKALSGTEIALRLGFPPERTFKTLVTAAPSKKHYVFAIPSGTELDLKKAARSVGEKSVAMLHVKDINQVTGYIRGGCTAIGMKKQFPTVIHESAAGLPEMIVSGGRLGEQIILKPEDLCKVTGGKFADIIRD